MRTHPGGSSVALGGGGGGGSGVREVHFFGNKIGELVDLLDDHGPQVCLS